MGLLTRVDRPSRRRLLTSLGSGAAALVAGCGALENEPTYEDGAIGDVDGEGRTPEEMTAAEALAEQEIGEGTSPLDQLSILEHQFVLEEGYEGSTVQGIVENASSERVQYAEVRVRVYDGDGDQLGRYLDTTGDLDGGSTWEFTVIVLESPADIAGYDITALGTPT